MKNKPAWANWYGLARWKKLRRRHLSKDPLCLYCKKEGLITAANVVDHVTPHRGDPALFWSEDNLQSLCKRHHDSDKQRFEKTGRIKKVIGPDGWPIEETGA